MNRLLVALALGAGAVLTGCGYNIVPEPPTDMPRADGKALPLRVGVRDAAVVGASASQELGGKVVDALRQSGLFKDVERIAPEDPGRGYDAIVLTTYKNTTSDSMIGFVFPPCLIPFVDFCIVPLGKVSIDIGAELNVTVADGGGQAIKSYTEKGAGECQYLPFPGLFPFNLALIGPDSSCHIDKGPQAAFQLALAKVVADLERDRATLAAGARPAAPAEDSGAPPAGSPSSESAPRPAAAPASGAKPWWQN